MVLLFPLTTQHPALLSVHVTSNKSHLLLPAAFLHFLHFQPRFNTLTNIPFPESVPTDKPTWIHESMHRTLKFRSSSLCAPSLWWCSIFSAAVTVLEWSLPSSLISPSNHFLSFFWCRKQAKNLQCIFFLQNPAAKKGWKGWSAPKADLH